MAYKVTIEEREGYIWAEVCGDRTPGRELDDAVSVWSRLAVMCREKKVSRVLVIVDLGGRLPTMSAYDLANSPEDFGWSWEFRVAVVDVNEASRRDNTFTETVAVNRGYDVKIFDNEQDAKTWLFAP